MSQELTGYLEQMTQEGFTDSHGSFTIDSYKALEKLSQRLFADSRSWLVKLVQAAYASGARQIQIVPKSNQLSIFFTSPSWTSAMFSNFREQLFLPWDVQKQAGLSHLISAIQVVRARMPMRLSWAVCDSQAGFSYLFHQAQCREVKLDGRSGEGSDCAFLLLADNSFMSWDKEKSVILSRCALSPLSIYWGDTLLSPSVPEYKSKIMLDRLYLSQSSAEELLQLPHLTQLSSMVYDLGYGYKDHYSYGNSIMHQWRSYKSSTEHNLWDSVTTPQFKVEESDVMQEILGIPKDAYALNHGLIRGGKLEGRNNWYQILYVRGLELYTRSLLPYKQGRFGVQPSLSSQAWLRCPIIPATGNNLQIQQDGVLLDPIPINMHLNGCVVYVADQAVQTDLSGLLPVRNERIEMLEKWLLAETDRCRGELRKVLRWGSKYGFNEQAERYIVQQHKLGTDE